ncbi:MAG: hypothetical protein IKS52_03925 [Clostridia bacterium]|nr:hypothetical protein [Clostridia bacterium]
MNENKNVDPKLQEVLKDIFDSLTDEQKEKAKQCRTMDELMELAGKEGIELPEEILDAVAGGVQAGSILGGGSGEFTGFDHWQQEKDSGGC